MNFRESLPHVESRARAKRLLDVTALEFFLQLFDCGNSELFVDTHHAFGIKARILADANEARIGVGAQALQLFKRSRADDLPDSTGDSFADPRELSQILFPAHHPIETFRQLTDTCCGALVGPDFIRIFFLGRRSCARLASRSAISVLLSSRADGVGEDSPFVIGAVVRSSTLSERD